MSIRSAGTDNAIYRLGDDMAVRLPRLPRAVEMLEKEQRWLPRLAWLLPLAVPTPLADSGPDDEFPYPWSVYRWLYGDNLAEQPDVDMDDLSVARPAAGVPDAAGSPAERRIPRAAGRSVRRAGSSRWRDIASVTSPAGLVKLMGQSQVLDAEAFIRRRPAAR